jgi:hypothetical protein
VLFQENVWASIFDMWKIFYSASIRTHEGERDKETSEVVQYIKQSTRNIVGDKKIYPETGTGKGRLDWLSRFQSKMSSSKKLTGKGTVR